MLRTAIFSHKGIVFLVILCFYVLFPTNNSSLDSYAYAGYVKYNHFLFTPHHLFSNALIYILWKPLKYLGLHFDVLSFSKFINSLFQLINLLVFYKILVFLKVDKKSRLLYIIILAFSFSLWRYGTENEAYIVPVSFSLLGSFYFLKNIKNSKTLYVILSSFFGVLACLFHQIHFFWWLGILIGFYLYSKKIKIVLIYLLPALLVPLSYVLVLLFYQQQELTFFNLQHFVFHDFYKGTVMSNFGWKGFFFQVLNTVRTYIQIHPVMYLMIKNNWMYLLPFLICFVVLWNIFKQFKTEKTIIISKIVNLKIAVSVHVFIFIANYLFAFYNYGNIEFMVMLPFLLVFCIAIKYNIHYKLLQKIAIFLFIWNFFYGIFPNFKYSYYNDKKLVNFMINNENKTFIIKNHTAKNQYFYHTGISNPKNIILYNKVSDKKIKVLIKNNEIYTDIINKPEILNKEKITSNKVENYFNNYTKEKMDTYEGFYGTSTIYKITKK